MESAPGLVEVEVWAPVLAHQVEAPAVEWAPVLEAPAVELALVLEAGVEVLVRDWVGRHHHHLNCSHDLNC